MAGAGLGYAAKRRGPCSQSSLQWETIILKRIRGRDLHVIPSQNIPNGVDGTPSYWASYLAGRVLLIPIVISATK